MMESPVRSRDLLTLSVGPTKPSPLTAVRSARLLETIHGFSEGFVVIESDVELDVVAVYTAAGKDGKVQTLHTDRVPARLQP